MIGYSVDCSTYTPCQGHTGPVLDSVCLHTSGLGGSTWEAGIPRLPSYVPGMDTRCSIYAKNH
ncbi:hypothetical protein EV126DRAFT_520880, partial [Verticillium dahliae]